MLTVTRWFYALFIVITWLGIVTLSRLIGLENFIWCVRLTDFAEIFISLKAPRGFSINRQDVKYRFFVHPNITKTNRIKGNNIFVKKNFCHCVDLFQNTFSQEYLWTAASDSLTFWKISIFEVSGFEKLLQLYQFLRQITLRHYLQQHRAKTFSLKSLKYSLNYSLHKVNLRYLNS